MSDIVVNLSGVIRLDQMEGRTADQLIDLALATWNVPKESVDAPFVTIHSRATNRHNPLQGTDVLGKLSAEDVVRVVLPLKSSPYEAMDSKQYLVEG